MGIIRPKRWQLLLLPVLLIIAALVISILPVQAQSDIGITPSELQLAVLSFDYPTVKVDNTDKNYLKINTGSVVYWFSKSSLVANDKVFDKDGTLLSDNLVWQLNNEISVVDIAGLPVYQVISAYHVRVSRSATLWRDCTATIIYDITGERTKATVEFDNGKAEIKELSVNWISSTRNFAEIESDYAAITYKQSNDRYLSYDWTDVLSTYGDVTTVAMTTQTGTKHLNLGFSVGYVEPFSQITLDPTQEYTSAGSFTWTCPAGVSLVTAETRGGGGSGGASAALNGAGGGGGGAYSKTLNISVTPGIGYSVVVGAAGTSPSGTGGDSSFGNSTPKECLAKGGIGGNADGGVGGAGGAEASGYGDTKYSGGKGGDGGYLLDGGGGEGACSTGTGNAGTSALPGIGGSGCDGGNGGNGASGGVCYAGTAPGGGGGGGLNYSTPNGAAGAIGKVVLTYYYTPTSVTDGTASMTSISCTLKGNITDDGGETPTYYKFEWDTDSGVPYANSYTSTEGSYPEGAYSRAIASLSAGILYYWRFGASNPSAGWGYSAETTLLTLPVKPSALADGIKTSESIAYTWTKGTGAQKTMVRYSDSGYPTAIDEGTQAYYDTGTSTTIESLDENTLYYISAWSYVTEGALEQWSSDYATDTAYTRPEDVATLTCGNETINSIDLDWTATDGADKYKIIRKAGGIPESVTDGTSIYFDTGLSTTSVGLQPNSLYGYGVWGYGNSSTLYSTTGATCSTTTLIDAPTITNSYGASSVGKTYATLNGEVTYTGGEDPNCYFYWGDEDGGTNPVVWDNQEIMGTQGSTFSKGLIGLTEGKTYYYITYGFNTGGEDWAGESAEFTCGCLDPGNITITQINDYKYLVEWSKTMPISVIKMGIGSAPTTPQDGTLVYRGNETSLYFYTNMSCITDTLWVRLWSDCTSCLTCTTFSYSDNYTEDSVALSGNCTGGGGMGSLTIVTDSGNATSVDSVIYMLGEGTISTVGGNNTVEIYGTTFLSLPDTPNSYAGQGGKIVRVNVGETGLEFATIECDGNCTGNTCDVSDCDPPSNLSATLVETNRIDLTWTSGNETMYTIIRAGFGSVPSSPLDGIFVFWGTGNSTSYYLPSEFVEGNITFVAWSDCCPDTGNLTFSSISTTDTMTGGESMGAIALFIAMFFGLAITIFGWHSKSLTIMLGATIAWIGIGSFGFSVSESAWDIYQIMGALSIAMIVVCLFVTKGQRDKAQEEKQKLIVKVTPIIPKNYGERMTDYEARAGLKSKAELHKDIDEQIDERLKKRLGG